MFCRECGCQLTDESKFCPNCGTGVLNADDFETNKKTSSEQPKKNKLMVCLVIAAIGFGFAIFSLTKIIEANDFIKAYNDLSAMGLGYPESLLAWKENRIQAVLGFVISLIATIIPLCYAKSKK